MKTIEYCPKCEGDGNVPVGESTGLCNRCGGDGQIERGFIDSESLEADIAKCLRRLKKIMDKLDITE
jgi:DnaJ-class molecular chaperone